jgi:hypothetical protein
MRFSTKWIEGAICVAAAFAFMAITAVPAQAAPQEVKATVFNLKGTANYQDAGGGEWKPVKNGTTLGSGATIKTDPGSTADLQVGKDKTRVQSGTTLKIDKLTSEKKGGETVTDTQFDLKAGNIIGNVSKKSVGSNYSVKTASGVAGIRGTIYNIYANGIVECVEGSIEVNFNGVKYQVPAGKAFIPGPPPTVGDLPATELVLVRQVTDEWTVTVLEVIQAPDGTTQVLTGGTGNTGDGGNQGKPAPKK